MVSNTWRSVIVSVRYEANLLYESLTFPEPWLHVAYFFIGGYVGQKWVTLERELVLDVNEIRADKGMPPLVGTNRMLGLKYQEEE